ncbi:PASTA domain-containing protein [Nocardioides alpinus]|uniref:PASTA domain-containing protein n=1 Tax=Nocardioides alpinus TaxID=748909 RepID=A0A1I0WDC5_9ACTN|nr:PASTA domain-containing protein [Nocardioides alpinus]SFA86170.1 PASTA domain-containing protein [Nocardioides alpinus]
MRPTTVKHVLAAAALLLAGCSGAAADREPREPAPAPVEDVDGGVDGGVVALPVLVGSPVRQVRRSLVDQGLLVAVQHRASCAPGVVLEQYPPAGAELPVGSTVRLVVSVHPPTASCIRPQAPEPARDLQRWALGDGEPPAFADRVRLWVANQPRRMLTRAQAARRSSWILDEPYAERRDARILESLAASSMRGTRVPPLWCVGRRPAPSPDLLRRLPWSWTLLTRRAEVRACMDVVAVQVWVDDARRITDVNLLMGSP